MIDRAVQTHEDEFTFSLRATLPNAGGEGMTVRIPSKTTKNTVDPVTHSPSHQDAQLHDLEDPEGHVFNLAVQRTFPKSAIQLMSEDRNLASIVETRLISSMRNCSQWHTPPAEVQSVLKVSDSYGGE
jgi:hypothetical protein